jgi:hypothetical protein
MAKVVKSFTVDKDDYNDLTEIFKKNDIEVSISAYVNSCLKKLSRDLKDVERGLTAFTKGREDKKFTVPMSFIINSILMNAIHPENRISSEAEEEGWIDEDDILQQDLESWQDDYDASTNKIPRPFLSWLRIGRYELSSDKKFLIDKETGQKFTAGKTRDSIYPVKE